MAMVVQHNAAAQLALGELNKNNDKLKKSLEKVSSGQKIVSAKNNASAYSISEKMREQIRTLQQDNQNVQNGSSLFKIADGGINSIVEELRSLKELAINSANDTNTDFDRATIQKVFRQKMANINNIATTTNYNGKTLLDGTYFKKTTEVTLSPIMIYDDGYNINSDGVYVLANGFTGTVNVNAQNVKIMQEDSSVALNNVYIIGPEKGNANLWIEDLNIENKIESTRLTYRTYTDKNVIKFQNANNILTVKGNNSLSILGYGDYNQIGARLSATINIGGGLTVKGDSSSSLNVVSTGADSRYNTATSGGACIGSDFGENDNTGNITIGGDLTITATNEMGAAIGGGHYGGAVGDINIGENVTIILKGEGGRIGAGEWFGGATGDI